MKTALTLVITAFVLLSGCATSRTVTDSAQQTGTLDQLYRETRERPVEVQTRDGQYWTDARLVLVRPDTVAWMDRSGRYFGAAPRDLASITYRQHAAGLGRGFMGGLGVSAAAAVLTYLLAPEGSGEGFIHFSRGDSALLVGAVVGLVAIPIGSLVGGLNGYRVTYRFGDESRSAEAAPAAPR